MSGSGSDATDARELAAACRAELIGDILPFWRKYARDEATGGFWAVLRNDGTVDAKASRSIVMTARHLWAYSAAARVLDDPSYFDMADFAYAAICRDFTDPEFGGVFWSVHSDGSGDVTKKQIYGEAFAMYALSEYATALTACRTRPDAAARAAEALPRALSIYELLEGRAREPKFGGYVESRARDWSATDDLKLSNKDIDCAKSMNTNLHVMEALTALLRALKACAGDNLPLRRRVEESLSALVTVTITKILGKDRHLDLYFNDDWSTIGDIVSYGHDIEASWLLWEAVEELSSGDAPGAHALEESVRPVVVDIARVSLAEGWDPATGGFENEFHGGHKDRTRVWWCQAESLVGFFNAWQLTGERQFLDAARGVWSWIDAHQRDRVGGDWFASVAPDGKPILSELKGGNWKTAYHNARSCMEIMARVASAR
jgi:mannobiose 2-epimerase